MNEQIVKAVASKTGLPADQVSKVVDAVLDFLKAHPDQLTKLMGGAGGGNISEKLGGLLGRD